MRAYPNVLLDPDEVVICIIDEEPQMFFAVESGGRLPIMNSVVGLAKAAKLFNIPVVLTTVAAETFSGPMYSKLQAVYPEIQPIDRTTLNSWEDPRVRKAIEDTGRQKIIIAGLWTEVCVALPTLSAMADGYEVFVVTDASGGASKEAHDMAILRMVQAGAVPLTWEGLMLEMQRDWANTDTYNGVMDIVKDHGGAYGLGVEYAQAMGIESRVSAFAGNWRPGGGWR